MTFRETRKQIVCDECSSVQLRGLAYRSDFETPRRLCRSCVSKHDNHPQIQDERDHLSAVEASQ